MKGTNPTNSPVSINDIRDKYIEVIEKNLIDDKVTTGYLLTPHETSSRYEWADIWGVRNSKVVLQKLKLAAHLAEKGIESRRNTKAIDDFPTEYINRIAVQGEDFHIEVAEILWNKANNSDEPVLSRLSDDLKFPLHSKKSFNHLTFEDIFSLYYPADIFHSYYRHDVSGQDDYARAIIEARRPELKNFNNDFEDLLKQLATKFGSYRFYLKNYDIEKRLATESNFRNDWEGFQSFFEKINGYNQDILKVMVDRWDTVIQEINSEMGATYNEVDARKLIAEKGWSLKSVTKKDAPRGRTYGAYINTDIGRIHAGSHTQEGVLLEIAYRYFSANRDRAITERYHEKYVPEDDSEKYLNIPMYVFDPNNIDIKGEKTTLHDFFKNDVYGESVIDAIINFKQKQYSTLLDFRKDLYVFQLQNNLEMTYICDMFTSQAESEKFQKDQDEDSYFKLATKRMYNADIAPFENVKKNTPSVTEPITNNQQPIIKETPSVTEPDNDDNDPFALDKKIMKIAGSAKDYDHFKHAKQRLLPNVENFDEQFLLMAEGRTLPKGENRTIEAIKDMIFLSKGYAPYLDREKYKRESDVDKEIEREKLDFSNEINNANFPKEFVEKCKRIHDGYISLLELIKAKIHNTTEYGKRIGYALTIFWYEYSKLNHWEDKELFDKFYLNYDRIHDAIDEITVNNHRYPTITTIEYAVEQAIKEILSDENEPVKESIIDKIEDPETYFLGQKPKKNLHTGGTAKETPSVPKAKNDKNDKKDKEDTMINKITITDAQLFTASLKRMFAFVTKDILRPPMTGVYVHQYKRKIRLVATDAHKLKVIELEGEAENEEGIILPFAVVKALIEKAPKGEITFDVSDEKGEDIVLQEKKETQRVDSLKTVARYGDTEYKFDRFDRRYPEYTALLDQGVISRIPDERKKPEIKAEITLSRSELLRDIDIVQESANTTTNMVCFSIKGTKLSLYAQDMDFQAQAQIDERIIKQKGGDITINYNAKFVIDILKSMDTENVVFKIQTNAKATYVLPDSESSEINLLMPVKFEGEEACITPELFKKGVDVGEATILVDKNLLDELAKAQKYTDTNSIPAFENYKIIARGKSLIFRAFADGGYRFEVEAEEEIENPFMATVPARDLLNLLKKLKGQTITLNFRSHKEKYEDATYVTISHPYGETLLSASHIEDMLETNDDIKGYVKNLAEIEKAAPKVDVEAEAKTKKDKEENENKVLNEAANELANLTSESAKDAFLDKLVRDGFDDKHIENVVFFAKVKNETVDSMKKSSQNYLDDIKRNGPMTVSFPEEMAERIERETGVKMQVDGEVISIAPPSVQEPVRFKQDEQVIFLPKSGGEVIVNFRGYNGATKAVILGKPNSGYNQMEVDISQLKKYTPSEPNTKHVIELAKGKRIEKAFWDKCTNIEKDYMVEMAASEYTSVMELKSYISLLHKLKEKYGIEVSMMDGNNIVIDGKKYMYSGQDTRKFIRVTSVGFDYSDFITLDKDSRKADAPTEPLHEVNDPVHTKEHGNVYVIHEKYDHDRKEWVYLLKDREENEQFKDVPESKIMKGHKSDAIATEKYHDFEKGNTVQILNSTEPKYGKVIGFKTDGQEIEVSDFERKKSYHFTELSKVPYKWGDEVSVTGYDSAITVETMPINDHQFHGRRNGTRKTYEIASIEGYFNEKKDNKKTMKYKHIGSDDVRWTDATYPRTPFKIEDIESDGYEFTGMVTSNLNMGNTQDIAYKLDYKLSDMHFAYIGNSQIGIFVIKDAPKGYVSEAMLPSGKGEETNDQDKQYTERIIEGMLKDADFMENYRASDLQNAGIAFDVAFSKKWDDWAGMDMFKSKGSELEFFKKMSSNNTDFLGNIKAQVLKQLEKNRYKETPSVSEPKERYFKTDYQIYDADGNQFNDFLYASENEAIKVAESKLSEFSIWKSSYKKAKPENWIERVKFEVSHIQGNPNVKKPLDTMMQSAQNQDKFLQEFSKETPSVSKPKKYKVQLTSKPNPDFMNTEDGRLDELSKEIDPFFVDVDSLKEAKEEAMKFISDNDLGSGNFGNAFVFDTDSKNAVARISYNGRIFDTTIPTKEKEIILDKPDESKPKTPTEQRSFILHAMFDRYRQGLKTNKTNITEIARQAGVEDVNWAYETVELSWVEWYRNMIQQMKAEGKNIREIVDAVWGFYETLQPTFTAMDSNKKIYQQYSTAAIISLLGGWFTDKGNDKNTWAFEASAGNGLFTIWYERRLIWVNELDKTRKNNLELGIPKGLEKNMPLMKYQQVQDKDASDDRSFEHFKNDFPVVITNPPFGPLIKSDYRINDMQVKMDEKMAQVALDTMKYDGRAAIVVGEHTDFTETGVIKGRRPFYNWLYKHYNVVDIINIDSQKLYQKQGTTYPLRMILIAGKKENPFGYAPLQREQPQLKEIVSTPYQLLERVILAKKKAENPMTTMDDLLKKELKKIKIELS